MITSLQLGPRVTRGLKWLGYVALYLGFFVVFAYMTFPYERLRQRIIAGYNSSQSKNAQPKRMEIGDLTWSWRFPGVVLQEVTLIGPKPLPDKSAPAIPAKSNPESDKPGADKPESARPKRETIYVEEVYAGVSLWSALTGAADVSFTIMGFGGEMEGSFVQSEEELSLNVEFQGVDPSQLPGVADTLQMPMEGRLTGNIDMLIPGGQYSKAEGSLELTVDELKVGDGKTKVRDLFALPTVSVGTLEVSADVKAGKVTVSKFSAAGQDLDVTLDGKIRLRDDVAQSRIEQMNLGFKFSDGYRNKDDTTRGLLGKPGDTRGGLIDMDPKVKQAKKPDGYYRWRLAGLISRPSFQPGRVATAARKGIRRAKTNRK